MKIGWYYTVGVWMIIVFSLGSCQEEQVVEVKSEEFSLPVTLEVDGYAHMDSAQVFFFRKFPDRDSLVFRQMVYDLGMQPRQIDFTLPLGVYDVLILGNVATDRIFERPPFSRDSICFFYTGEQAIPAIYWGARRVIVGADTLVSSAMLLMTAAVEVTVQQVPAGVDRIDVVLTNTAWGFTMRQNLIERPIEPELSVSLTDVQVDSSYTVEMSGLPSVQKYGQSQVVVRCYDTVGKLVFSGESVSFPSQQGRKRVVKCTFQSALQHITRGVTNSGWNNRDLIWQYEK